MRASSIFSIITVLIFSLFSSLCFAGCAVQTPIFDGEKIITFDEVQPKTKLLSLLPDWQLCYRKVLCSESYVAPQAIALSCGGDETIVVADDQQFLCADTYEWVRAEDLSVGSRLVSIGNDFCIVQKHTRINKPTILYKLNVGEPHTFFISRWCILTHNCSYLVSMKVLRVEATTIAKVVIATANTVLGDHIAALLSRCGLHCASTGIALTVPTVITPPLMMAVASVGAVGYLGYKCYQWWNHALSPHEVQWILDVAQRIREPLERQLREAADAFRTIMKKRSSMVVFDGDRILFQQQEKPLAIPKFLENAVAKAEKLGKKPKEPRELKYEPSDKHHKVSLLNLDEHIEKCTSCKRGIISPGPNKEEGWAILNFLSFSISYTLRAAYIMGRIVMFRFTREDPDGTVYHGYFDLKQSCFLESDIQKVFRREGLIKGKNKLIRDHRW